MSFLFSYVMIFKDPAISALAGWLVAMTTRQTGHFFFEPKDYDVVNKATHEYKEEIKVGYNLRRKVVLLTIWALSPLVLFFNPRFFGLFTPAANKTEFVRHVAIIWLGARHRRRAVPHHPVVRDQGRADRVWFGPPKS